MFFVRIQDGSCFVASQRRCFKRIIRFGVFSLIRLRDVFETSIFSLISDL